MTEYQPEPGRPDPRRPQPRAEAPPSIQTAVKLVWAIVALSVLNTILTFVYLDDLVATTMEAQGAGADESAVRTGVVVGGIFGLLIFGALWVLLAIFLRKGANWARIVLTVLAAIGVVFGLIGLMSTAQPIVFFLTSLVTLVLEAALLYFLWQKDASAYLKPGRAS